MRSKIRRPRFSLRQWIAIHISASGNISELLHVNENGCKRRVCDPVPMCCERYSSPSAVMPNENHLPDELRALIEKRSGKDRRKKTPGRFPDDDENQSAAAAAARKPQQSNRRQQKNFRDLLDDDDE